MVVGTIGLFGIVSICDLRPMEMCITGCSQTLFLKEARLYALLWFCVPQKTQRPQTSMSSTRSAVLTTLWLRSVLG